MLQTDDMPVSLTNVSYKDITSHTHADMWATRSPLCVLGGGRSRYAKEEDDFPEVVTRQGRVIRVSVIRPFAISIYHHYICTQSSVAARFVPSNARRCCLSA